MKKPCIVLVSGGLDSAVTLAVAIDRGFGAHGLTVRYGQRHEIELQCSQNVCKAIGAEDHKIIDLDLRLFGGSALTADHLEVPKGPRPTGAPAIPVTYVPARNTVFLSLALSWAEAIGARDIFIGVSAVDYSGYPDCRMEYIRAFEAMANLGTRASEGGEPFRIHAPLIGLTKGETIDMGHALGVDFGLTWTCYDPGPGGRPCGTCESCFLRAKGFSDAGTLDPVLNRPGKSPC